MKTAVILAGGKGLRLYPNTSDTPKPMIVVNDRPIMDYIMLMLQRLGFEKAHIIVGYKKESIMDYFKNGEKHGLHIEYIENNFINEPKKSGLSDALLLVKDIIAEPFMTILGDEIYVGTKHKEMIHLFEKNTNYEAMVAVYESDNMDDVKKNYSVKIDRDWSVSDLEEKPVNPWNNLVGCGTYLFKPYIFNYIEKTKVSSRTGRKELADTLKLIIKDKKVLKAFNIGGKYINITYPKDLDYAKNIIERA